MKNIKQVISILLTILLASVTSCTGKTTDKQQANSSEKYNIYHNDRYGYTVAYPEFLIPQGETDSQDGQRFISQDQRILLLVYRDYKINFLSEEGAEYSLQEAYENDLSTKRQVLNSKIENNGYTICYKQDEKRHTLYAHKTDNGYINILLSYPEQEEDKIKEVEEYVINSLTIGEVEHSQENNTTAESLEDMFQVFVKDFLAECYWNKNINALLRDNDKTLAKYIDAEMDVRRYYAPGAATLLAGREEQFAFDAYTDFDSKIEVQKNIKTTLLPLDNSPCELNFSDKDKVYYQKLHRLPVMVVNQETLETASVETAYPEAEIMAVYVPDTYGNPLGLYFINTPNGWKLAFIDNSLCSA